jgi:hypothetical protein
MNICDLLLVMNNTRRNLTKKRNKNNLMKLKGFKKVLVNNFQKFSFLLVVCMFLILFGLLLYVNEFFNVNYFLYGNDVFNKYNVSFSDEIFEENLSIDNTTIIITAKNMSKESYGLVVDFDYESKIDVVHACIVGLLVNGIHNTTSDNKVILMPNNNFFRLIFALNDKNVNNLQIYYRCRII